MCKQVRTLVEISANMLMKQNSKTCLPSQCSLLDCAHFKKLRESSAAKKTMEVKSFVLKNVYIYCTVAYNKYSTHRHLVECGMMSVPLAISVTLVFLTTAINYQLATSLI